MERMNKVVRLIGLLDIHYVGRKTYEFVGKRCWYNDGTYLEDEYRIDFAGKRWTLETKVSGRTWYTLRCQDSKQENCFNSQADLVRFMKLQINLWRFQYGASKDVKKG